jgi:hypothetical protein
MNRRAGLGITGVFCSISFVFLNYLRFNETIKSTEHNAAIFAHAGAANRAKSLGTLLSSQRLNHVADFVRFAFLLRQRHADITEIPFHRLKELGFEGVVFDKDNTLTVPHKFDIHPPLQVQPGKPASRSLMIAIASTHDAARTGRVQDSFPRACWCFFEQHRIELGPWDE